MLARSTQLLLSTVDADANIPAALTDADIRRSFFFSGFIFASSFFFTAVILLMTSKY